MRKRGLPAMLFDNTYGARAASARRHSQQPSDDMMKCPSCRENNCTGCPDKLLLLVGRSPVCTCKREGHDDAINGEPRRVQVQDPMTGDIYGPAGGPVVRQEPLE